VNQTIKNTSLNAEITIEINKQNISALAVLHKSWQKFEIKSQVATRDAQNG